MRAALVFFRVLLWTVLVILLFLQLLSIYAISSGSNYSVIPLVCTCLLMAAGTVLFFIKKEKRYIGITICAAAAVAFIFIAIDIYREFPERIQAYGTTGISLAKAIWRHGSPVILPVLMLPIWGLEKRLELRSEIRKVKKKAAPFKAILPENQNISEDALPTAKKKQKGIRIRKK